MNIQPVADRILIRPIKAEETTKSGIILAQKTEEKKDQAEIVAIGPDVPEYLKVGAKILYAKYSGEDTDLDGDKLAFIRPDDVFAILE